MTKPGFSSLQASHVIQCRHLHCKAKKGKTKTKKQKTRSYQGVGSGQKNSQGEQTSKATIGLFMHAFYKYLLSAYHVLGTLIDSMGIEMIND